MRAPREVRMSAEPAQRPRRNPDGRSRGARGSSAELQGDRRSASGANAAPKYGWHDVTSGWQFFAYLFSGRAMAFNVALIVLPPVVRQALVAVAQAVPAIVPQLPAVVAEYNWVPWIVLVAMGGGASVRQIFRRLVNKKINELSDSGNGGQSDEQD